MAPRRSKRCKEKDTAVPEGWFVADHRQRNGKVIKYYGNRLGQKFFSMKDLLSYVEYAKRNQFSIYAPGFEDANTNSEDKEPEADAVAPSNLKEMESNAKGKKSYLNLACSSDVSFYKLLSRGFIELADSNLKDKEPGAETGTVSGLKKMDTDAKGKAPEPSAAGEDKEQTVPPFKKIKLILHPDCSKHSMVPRPPPRRSARLASRTQT